MSDHDDPMPHAEARVAGGHGHKRTEYSCGHVQSQCRCMSPDKEVVVLPEPCPACVLTQEMAQSWTLIDLTKLVEERCENLRKEMTRHDEAKKAFVKAQARVAKERGHLERAKLALTKKLEAL